MQVTSTEEKILLAARKIFVDKGLEGARMQDIADEAGINKAMLHYYFRSKGKLFDTIFTDVAKDFLPKLFAILAAATPLFEKIRLFCDAYIEQEIKTPYVPVFIINEINRDPGALVQRIMQVGKPPFDVVVVQIKKEAKAGIIKPVEPMELLLTTLSLCIFPYLVKPMVQTITGMDTEQFNTMMKNRSAAVSRMIIDSIKV
ncbi:MAG TPA: TetR/AcrR family transcriptional regulator [Flavisolibacter sp.]|nr:TetR/AcrR family transcriptional regulator [Flavisolibacter sp.]